VTGVFLKTCKHSQVRHTKIINVSKELENYVFRNSFGIRSRHECITKGLEFLSLMVLKCKNRRLLKE